jgi:hypothetical protein
LPAIFSIAADGAYLIHTVIGDHPAAMQRETAPQLFALMHTTGITRALIDARAQQQRLPAFAAVELWDQFTPRLPRGAQFAVLVNWPLKGHPFMETVAVNRGVNVRYFNDYDQAVAWLQAVPRGQ